MSENTVLIEGEEYISSNRAAKLVGYTKDYVGQLARAGKIKAKRVGRSWYIAESSINKHKLSVHYILTKPKKNRIEEHLIKSEKTNQNIVKSPIQNSYIPKNRAVPEAIKEQLDESSIQTPSLVREDDFLPRLKEKKRDVLLHTDFRYEKSSEKPHDIEAVSKSLKNQEVSKNVFDYKKVEIRKPLTHKPPLQRSVLRSRDSVVHTRDSVRNTTRYVSMNPRISNSTPRIDGIVVPARKRMRMQEERYVYPKNEQTSFEYEAPVTTVRNKNSRHTTRNSKAVPVIGAISIFTLAVVLYIFSTLS